VTIERAILVGLLLAFTSPVTFAQDDDAEDGNGSERICVNVRAIRSFDALTDNYVYVREGSSKHYLFTMRNRCHNLRNAMGIAIKDMISRVCSDGFGEILYRDQMGGRRLESCRIGSIEAVDSKDHAKEIVTEKTGRE